MASPYVLSNYQLQYISSSIATSFQFVLAVYNPVAITVASQDVATDQYGNPTNIPNVDLIATHVQPYAPQANFGSNRVCFAGQSLFFDGSRSTQRHNLPVHSYSWSFPGSSNTTLYTGPNSSSGSQALVTYDHPGLYTASLTVTDRFGNSHTGHRQIMVYQDLTTVPQGLMSIESLTGTVQNGGWTGQLAITTTPATTPGLATGTIVIPNPDELPVGTYVPIVLYLNQNYEIAPGTWNSFQVGPYTNPQPGQYYDDPHIFFSGYVTGCMVEEFSDYDSATYNISTVDAVLSEAGIHNIGYYNCTYKTYAGPGGEPSAQNTSSLGQGQQVTDLSGEDLYRSVLADHCTVAQYHDVNIWRPYLPDIRWYDIATGSSTLSAPASFPAVYYPLYSTLTANEGTIMDALNLMAANDFCAVWGERTGSINVGPILDMRGAELTAYPTAYGTIPLAWALPTEQEYKNWSSGQIASTRVYVHNWWGVNPIPVDRDGGARGLSGYVRDLSGLYGPPIAFHVSDAPGFDTAPSAPSDPNLWSWVTQNWPQDLAIHPVDTQVTENYTTREAFLKVVSTFVTGQNVWSAWYPQAYFGCNSLMQLRVPAGTWQVTQQSIVPDATTSISKDGQTVVWNYLWEMTRRQYYADNAPYQVQATVGFIPWVRLNDLFHFSRSRVVDGPVFNKLLCYVTELTYNIDLTQQTWTTQINGNQVTQYGLGAPVTALCPIPTGTTG